jgi:sterol desaturase/sphingolipid hydroxylase (fatty acid hydroxylase superfamily)
MESIVQADVFNTLGALIGLYVVFDFFYMSFHRALHHGSVYKFVHKHHHRQKAPSRGNRCLPNVLVPEVRLVTGA